MRDFDFYEFVGVLMPGATVVFGSALLELVDLPFMRTEDSLSFGDLGATVVLSYVAGHLLQAFGNWFETGWWRLWRGRPTDWVRRNTRDDSVLSARQKIELDRKIRELCEIPQDVSLHSVTASEWRGITSQIYASVANAGRSSRVDIFNGNYGLLRGLTVAFLLLLLGTIIYDRTDSSNIWLLLAASLLALFRMHRFGIHYARELFIRFLNLSDKGSDATV
jgi:hypothetical protein